MYDYYEVRDAACPLSTRGGGGGGGAGSNNCSQAHVTIIENRQAATYVELSCVVLKVRVARTNLCADNNEGNLPVVEQLHDVAVRWLLREPRVDEQDLRLPATLITALATFTATATFATPRYCTRSFNTPPLNEAIIQRPRATQQAPAALRRRAGARSARAYTQEAGREGVYSRDTGRGNSRGGGSFKVPGAMRSRWALPAPHAPARACSQPFDTLTI